MNSCASASRNWLRTWSSRGGFLFVSLFVAPRVRVAQPGEGLVLEGVEVVEVEVCGH